MFAFLAKLFTVSFVPIRFRSKNRSNSLKAGERESSKTSVGGRFFAASDRKIQLKLRNLGFLKFFLNILQFLLYPTKFDPKIAHIV